MNDAEGSTGKVSGIPRLILRAEAMLVFFVALTAYREVDGSWGTLALVFLVPDLSMLGYLINPRVGSISYNLGHSYGLALFLGLAGYFGSHLMLLQLSLIWSAHIGFDRMLGYGLKYGSAFRETHLGRLGKVTAS